MKCTFRECLILNPIKYWRIFNEILKTSIKYVCKCIINAIKMWINFFFAFIIFFVFNAFMVERYGFLWLNLIDRRGPRVISPSSPVHTTIENKFNLSFDGVFKTISFVFFICKNNRKDIKIMHCDDLFFFWVVALKIWAFFTYFIYLSVMGRYNPIPHQN